MMKRGIYSALALTLAVPLWFGVPHDAAEATEAPKPPPHHMPGGVGLCGDTNYLYVVRAGRILQYVRTDLSTVNNTVDLPRPTPPSKAAYGAKGNSTETAPSSPRGGGMGCWADGASSLYVVTGPLILQYEASDLTLKTTVELPRPEPPSTSTSQ